MSDKKKSSDPGGQQPEALASLEDAARSGSKKASDQGLRAKPETAIRSVAKAAALRGIAEAAFPKRPTPNSGNL